MTGAVRWRSPDDALPKDLRASRAENSEALRKPLDPAAFIGELREEMETELAALHEALPALDWLQIKERKNGGAGPLPPPRAGPPPREPPRPDPAVQTPRGTPPPRGPTRAARRSTRASSPNGIPAINAGNAVC